MESQYEPESGENHFPKRTHPFICRLTPHFRAQKMGKLQNQLKKSFFNDSITDNIWYNFRTIKKVVRPKVQEE